VGKKSDKAPFERVKEERACINRKRNRVRVRVR
jgi:hypothetical protein